MKEDSEWISHDKLVDIDPVREDWKDISPLNARVLNIAFGSGWRMYSQSYADLLSTRLNRAIDSGLSKSQGKFSTHNLRPQSRSQKPSRSTRLYSYALVFTTAICMALGMSWFANGFTDLFRSGESVSHSPHVYTTALGERATVVLPDGSTAILNAGSKLTVSSLFGSTDRQVTIEGEAYFSIVPKTTKPFLVHAGSSMTKVLGTEFNIRAYPTDSSIEVAVISGKVLVGHTIVAAGGIAEVVDSRDPVILSDRNVSRHIEWTRGNLVFDNIPFSRILHRMERMYDIEVRVSDSTLGSHNLSGTLRTPSLSDAINYFSAMLNAEAYREGRIITFHKKSD